MDGDTRGGSALSVRAVSGKPIKFMGVGEGTSHRPLIISSILCIYMYICPILQNFDTKEFNYLNILIFYMNFDGRSLYTM